MIGSPVLVKDFHGCSQALLIHYYDSPQTSLGSLSHALICNSLLCKENSQSTRFCL